MNARPTSAKRTVADPSKSPRSRSKGRPSAEEARVGCDLIVERTCDLLRSHPPSQVTRVMAARASGVHPSLIHYYFKTRSSLLIAAAERLTAEFRQSILKRLEGVDGSPRERLLARLEALIDLELRYPYYHRLLVEEVLPSDDPAAQALTQGLATRGIARYQEIIEDGVKSNELRQIDSAWLFASVISLCQFFENAKVLYRALAQPKLSDAYLEQSYRKFLIDFVMNAVACCPTEKSLASDSKGERS